MKVNHENVEFDGNLWNNFLSNPGTKVRPKCQRGAFVKRQKKKKKKPTWEVRLFEYFGPLGLGEEQHLIQSFEFLT
jgi:hypothetical protein